MEEYLSYFQPVEDSIKNLHTIGLDYTQYPYDLVLFFIAGFLLYFTYSVLSCCCSGESYVYNTIDKNKIQANNQSNISDSDINEANNVRIYCKIILEIKDINSKYSIA